MAPNTKHTSLIAQQLINLQIVRVKDVDYQVPTPVVDSALYWEWPSATPPDFSIEHTESNLISSASQVNSKSQLKAENDDYWAEECDHVVLTETLERQAAPQEKIDSNDYWAEESYETMSSDDYWNTASAVTRTVVQPTVIRNPDLVEAESASYWQEKTHGRSSSDAYWQEDLPSQNYWTWNVAAKTERDDYWGWTSPVATL